MVCKVLMRFGPVTELSVLVGLQRRSDMDHKSRPTTLIGLAYVRGARGGFGNVRSDTAHLT